MTRLRQCCDTITIIASIVALLVLWSRAFGQTYTVTDLGTFQPRAINGPWVVGAEHGFAVRLNLDTGEKINLGLLGDRAVANGVTSRGEAVGTTQRVTGGVLQNVATFWAADGRAVTLQSSLPSEGIGINEERTMAGVANCPGGRRAMRWWFDGRVDECLPLPDFFATRNASVAGIDGQHRVWGTTDAFAPVLAWDVDGTVHNFGAKTGDFYGETLGVSANSVAVGYDRWMFTIEGGFIDLADVRSGPDDCYVRGVNQSRQAVGQCYARGFPTPRHAYLWPTPTTVVNLNDAIPANSGMVLTNARGISDEGKIIGNLADGRGFLLTPPAMVSVMPSPDMVSVQVTRGGVPLAGVPVWIGVVDGITWRWHPSAVAYTDETGVGHVQNPLPPDTPGTHHVLGAAWLNNAAVTSQWASYSGPAFQPGLSLSQQGRSVVAFVGSGTYGIASVPVWGYAILHSGEWIDMGVGLTDSQGRRVITPPPMTALMYLGSWWGEAQLPLQEQVASR